MRVVEPSTPFAAFDSSLILFFGNHGKDAFLAWGSFSLGAENDGIDPLAEPVMVSLADTVGTFFTQTLSPGSFELFRKGGFLFHAPRGSTGIRLMIIRPTESAGEFTFIVLGKRLDLRGAENVFVTVSLQIGNDADGIPDEFDVPD